MLPYALLHGGMVDENATAVQQFIDSEPGNNVGVFFHTIGAAFFIGASLVLMLWAWNNRRGFVDPARYHVVATQWILLTGMGMNGLGGLIRLEQSDHPGLEDLGTNPWVDYIFYKHIGLVAANVLALALLVWYVPKRHRVLWWPPAGLGRRKDPPQPDGGEFEEAKPKRATLAAAFAAFIVLASLVAGVLGAAATTVGPGTEEESDVGAFRVHETASPPLVEWVRDSGSFQAAAPVVQQQSADHPFAVARNVLRAVVTVNITGAAPTAQITITLFDPGTVSRGTATASPSQPTATVTVDAPQSGGWFARVTPTAGANVNYDVAVRLEQASFPATVVEGTAVIPPGAFAELNFNMSAGDSFEFRWETAGGEALDFDVHWHEGATVHEQHVMTTCCVEDGMTYTAEVSDLHSPEWINEGPTPVKVAFVISGTFKFDSAAGF